MQGGLQVPAQAATAPQYRYGIVPMAESELTASQRAAVKADALHTWEKVPKLRVSSTTKQSAPARPPSDPTSEVPPTLTVPDYTLTGGSLNSIKPLEWEVLGKKTINQCFPDNHDSVMNFGVSHLAWCTKGIARAVVWDIFGNVVSQAPMVETTLLTKMDRGRPTRQVRAVMMNWVGETVGSIDPSQVNNGPIRFVMHCTAGLSATGCIVGGYPDGRTRSVQEWRADTTGVTEWTFDAPSGDGWSQGPKTDRAAFYNLDSFGEWVNGTNSTWGQTSFRCDYSPSMAWKLGETWLNPTGCVFPSARDTWSRLSLLDDVTASDARPVASHIDFALRDPGLTNPPPTGKPPYIKNIPGAYPGTPLTRYYGFGSKVSRRIVQTACENYDPNWANGALLGWQCDEYPFASTYETANNGGDYSVRMMPASANGAGGNYLNGWYNAFRYLNGDKFYVAVRP